MQLILKPTAACNFACTFCSANKLKLKHLVSVPDELKKLLDALKPQDIILTGGEPLLCPMSFYEELLNLGSWSLSFTTNLKAFYESPEFWTTLFKNRRVGVCTSFQYGPGRCWSAGEPYTEQKFIEVEELFRQKVGYAPTFIAVLSNDNEQYAMKHLELARKLGTKCKLNGVLPVGLSKEFFPRWKLFKIWLDALDAGFGDVLDIQTAAYQGGCGLNTNYMCQSTIGACEIAEDGKLQYAACEEDLNAQTDLILPPDHQLVPHQMKIHPNTLISKKCLTCKLCRLCNGCKHARNGAYHDDKHCEEMKKLEDRIVAAGWRL